MSTYISGLPNYIYYGSGASLNTEALLYKKNITSYSGLIFFCSIYCTSGRGIYLVNYANSIFEAILIWGNNVASFSRNGTVIKATANSGFSITSVWWTLLG